MHTLMIAATQMRMNTPMRMKSTREITPKIEFPVWVVIVEDCIVTRKVSYGDVMLILA